VYPGATHTKRRSRVRGGIRVTSRVVV
jgi:hypothetical protein